jgi:hypothetical protein
MPQNKPIHIRYEDVAVPEITIDDEEELEDSGERNPDDEIAYDDVALPEIHPHKHNT